MKAFQCLKPQKKNLYFKWNEPFILGEFGNSPLKEYFTERRLMEIQ